MPTAERSYKAAVEYEQDVRLAAKIGQANRLALEIGQSEVRGRGVKWDLRHQIPLYRIYFNQKDRNKDPQMTASNRAV